MGETVYGVALDDVTVLDFRRDGFAVLRRAFDASCLADEMERVFADAFLSDVVHRGSGGIRFSSVPMMSGPTPISTSLADALAESARRLLGRAVLPGRAKGTRYFGESDWHTDSDLDIPSIGFVAYFEPLRGGRGALEVRPGSHRTDVGQEHAAFAVETEPGDVIAFDEHLAHGSVGGDQRRQWRVDFIADPENPREEALLRLSFAHIFDVSWDGGYDVDRYPSYGDSWQAAHRVWAKRLRDLGVIELAREQEAVMRERANGPRL